MAKKPNRHSNEAANPGGLIFFLGLDLLLLLHHGTRRPGKRLIDEIGGKVFLGLSCQSEPSLGHGYQQDFILGIGGVVCDA
jgi:hypothetical protein